MHLDTGVEGWLWLATALWLGAMLPCFLKSPRVLFILGVLLDLIVWGIVLMDFGFDKAIFAPITAWGLLIAGILGIYLAAAVAINTEFGKAILYVGGPLVKTGVVAAASAEIGMAHAKMPG